MDKLEKKALEAVSKLLGLKTPIEGSTLAALSDEQLVSLAEKAAEAYEAAKQARDLAEGTVAQNLILAARSETTRRAAEAQEVESKFAELDTALKDEAADDDDEGNDEENDDDKDAGNGDGEKPTVETPAPANPAVVETPAPVVETPAPATPVVETETESETAPVPVAAAGTKKVKKSVPKPSGSPAAAKPKVTITASADVKDVAAGAELSIDQMASAWVAKAEAIRGTRNFGHQYPVATLRASLGDDRQLSSRNPAEVNSAIINEWVKQAQEDTRATLAKMLTTQDSEEMVALTAAGGLCAPTPVRYEILEIGEDNRPLRDSLTRLGVDRGGIRYIDADTIPYMADVEDALGHFTEAQDTTGDDYPKPCLRVDCPTWIETLVEADTLCMIVGLWQRLTYPENFRAWWRQAFVARARAMETRLWDKMVALSTAVTAGEGLDATIDVLTQIERAAAQMRWRYRISPLTPLRLWAPDFLKAIMRTGLARRQAGDGLGVLEVSDAQLARYFAARNIAVTFVLDAQSPGGTSGDIQAAGALNPWPSTVEVILAVEGTFALIEMDGVNFGTEIRDFDMIRNNDVGAFLESFENVIRVGVQPLALTLNICPDGTTAGVDSSFNPCTSGS